MSEAHENDSNVELVVVFVLSCSSDDILEKELIKGGRAALGSCPSR